MILLVSILAAFGMLFGSAQLTSAFSVRIEERSDFLELDRVLKQDGYVSSEPFVYSKEKPDIEIRFDAENKIVKKNDFIFEVENEFEIRNNTVYMSTSAIGKIINKNITRNVFGQAILNPLVFEKHGWTQMTDGLVAHAGGGIFIAVGTNAYEAIVKNYSEGHRVFEIDFNLTTDGKLAAVHDWRGYGGMMSSKDWLKVRVHDVYTALLLEDILEMMLVNQDMFLVTDTKSFEYTEEQTKQQFQIIVDEARKLDESLLKRIVPQIYNRTMYDWITEIYPFESIIYTLYASPDSDKEVVDFVKDKEAIKVITMGPVRFSENFYGELGNNNKYIYFFTLNNHEEVNKYREMGIKGFYTDFILPN